jgi:hypothetical protein
MSRLLRNTVMAATTAMLLGACPSVYGQFEQQVRLRRYSGARFTNARSVRGAILNRPTVSPYLALTDVAGTGNVNSSSAYFTQVRPRLENQEQSQQQQRSIMQLQRTVNTLGSSAARSQQQASRATGHPTRFGTYLHYYPGLGR